MYPLNASNTEYRISYPLRVRFMKRGISSFQHDNGMQTLWYLPNKLQLFRKYKLQSYYFMVASGFSESERVDKSNGAKQDRELRYR
jgi:hypothetical protein